MKNVKVNQKSIDKKRNTEYNEDMKIDIQLTMIRIQNARRAMVRAQNPKFREFWDNVANELFAKLEHCGQPWLRTYDGKLN